MGFEHISVLAEPTVNALIDPKFGSRKKHALQSINLNGVFVDGTFGRGGHSRLLLDKLGDKARLIVFDKDPEAINVAQGLANKDPRVIVVHDGFSSLPVHLNNLGIENVDGIMMDLGVSSPQIDDASRGFSFMRDGPLDMRMDTSSGITAAQWLADVSQDELKEVIADYGEERYAFKIAKTIVSSRQSSPLHTTHQLAQLVAGVVRTREKGQHPATRTFQAIRIYINQELEQLADALASIVGVLGKDGRMAIISFHSLEDRMVKRCIAKAANPQAKYARMPIAEKDMPKPTLVNLGKFTASAEEIKANPRSRSAVLRVAQRTEYALENMGGNYG